MSHAHNSYNVTRDVDVDLVVVDLRATRDT